MLKTELLETFVTVCETGNFSKAAEIVCRSQSALSLQIKKLEENVGQQLLLRDNKGVQITPAGETLLAYAKRMLALSNEALEDLNGNVSSKEIRLGVPTDYINCYLNSKLLEFIKKFTDIQLHIDTDVSGNLLNRLNNDEFDVIVATNWQVPEHGELLFERRFVWVAAAQSQLLNKPAYDVALYPENCPIRVQVFANHSLTLKPISVLLSSPSPVALCMAVENDLVVAPIAEFRVTNKMQILDPEQHQLPKLPMFNESIYCNPNSTSPELEQLIQLIRSSKEELIQCR
ncbi:LysR family transcriptional regulator [Paraferrimonas haliotis]|uniref:LysR family transcriptional regulator n=1 Tax=Paraferrimonas haliotis TaxID=2013866 RepID=A0AA37WW58_9GAMM|nr:LysR family transcriptional regulator [Paraferrimonas haliotis]GLS82982.1 LysR family transcriptional regulator [Paraferrimonas haliotis]